MFFHYWVVIVHLFFPIANLAFRLQSVSLERDPETIRLVPPHLKSGTKNWERLNSHGRTFTPRHSHASCTFSCPRNRSKKCLWITGGYSELHRSFDLEMDNKNADVWYSEDGAKWTQVTTLDGDFSYGNHDAKPKSVVAPWYGRYGHSLNVVRVFRSSDGNSVSETNKDPRDVMILTGGFSPTYSNDVWISLDGETWRFDGHAPWAGRAYHGAIVFKEELWIMGGTPLQNDIWIGTLVEDNKKQKNQIGYKMVWRMHLEHINNKPVGSNIRWSPRAAFCTTTQRRRESNKDDDYEHNTNGTSNVIDHLYVMGGFGGYPDEDRRTRNDVWITNDGIEWVQILPDESALWGARGWHKCVTWHDEKDHSVSARYNDHDAPRIYLFGGGYLGANRNNEVRSIEGYVDMWWTKDGSVWNEVTHREGRGSALYSTAEAYLTYDNDSGNQVYLGKWGHTVELFHRSVDINRDGVINTDNQTVEIEFCADVVMASKGKIDEKDKDSTHEESPRNCIEYVSIEKDIPALFVIGGDTVDDGPIVNDVYVTDNGGKSPHIN